MNNNKMPWRPSAEKRARFTAADSRFLAPADILPVPVDPCGEPIVPIGETDKLIATQMREEMLAVTGERIYVRQSVARLLGEASMLLAAEEPGTNLRIGYGYRSLSIQQNNFEKEKEQQRQRTGLDGPELDAVAHNYVAIPEIAGHPAGAAVDIFIEKDGQPLDCGTPIWTFTEESQTFSPNVAPGPKGNRMLLRRIMMSVGFAPFDGEWWHFSYGDKEWAAYYGMPNAVYEQVEFSTTLTPEV